DRAPVVASHARTEAIKDAGDPRVHAVRAVVGHRDRLGKALRFVVDAAWADRVHVAPVVLALRVNVRVAVDLRRRGEQEPSAGGLGHAARDERPHRERQAGSTGLRPIEWYSKPKRRIRSGSQRLRPSKTIGRRMTARSRSRFRSLNSFHSVTRATASASVAAAYGESQ